MPQMRGHGGLVRGTEVQLGQILHILMRESRGFSVSLEVEACKITMKNPKILD